MTRLPVTNLHRLEPDPCLGHNFHGDWQLKESAPECVLQVLFWWEISLTSDDDPYPFIPRIDRD